jgi:phospholipase/carboxylesterase
VRSAPGLRSIGLSPGRDGLVYVPESVNSAQAAPLIVLLHGAGGDARQMVPLLQEQADARGIVLLAPDSRGRTWDVILRDYGPDVAFLDRALEQVFARHAVDPERLAIGGFSDGASYALSLGLTNGALFTHVLAFSPGFMAPTRTADNPRFFVSHGVADDVLPIERTSRHLAPELRRAGYDLEYREFPGGHVVPPEIVRAGVDWFLRRVSRCQASSRASAARSHRRRCRRR